MLSSQKTRGSAHIIIIVCLVAALVGALGVAAYQSIALNQQKKSTSDGSVKASSDTSTKTSTDTATPVAAATMNTINMNTVFSPGITFDYPINWSENHQIQGSVPSSTTDTTLQTYNIVSQDKTIDLSIRLAVGGGLGGACNPAEESNLDLFVAESSSRLPGYSYVEYVYQNQYQSNQWIVQQGLALTEKTRSLGAGTSSCNVSYLFVPSLPKAGGTHDPEVLLMNGISRHGVTDMVGFATLSEAKAYLGTENAKAIKAIILSIR